MPEKSAFLLETVSASIRETLLKLAQTYSKREENEYINSREEIEIAIQVDVLNILDQKGKYIVRLRGSNSRSNSLPFPSNINDRFPSRNCAEFYKEALQNTSGLFYEIAEFL